MGRGVLQSLSGVGCHQLTHLTRFAEGQRAQAMLYTLSLHSNDCTIMLCTKGEKESMPLGDIKGASVPRSKDCYSKGSYQ